MRSADFFDVKNHPTITFKGGFTERTGATTLKGEVDLTIRGITAAIPLDVHYLGERRTPFWVGEENKGELRRIGFEASGRINRHDFGISWQDQIPGGGIVVSNEIELNNDLGRRRTCSSRQARSGVSLRVLLRAGWPAHPAQGRAGPQRGSR